jgi:hypothetical protein
MIGDIANTVGGRRVSCIDTSASNANKHWPFGSLVHRLTKGCQMQASGRQLSISARLILER